jgi:ERCC4-type nuclease
MSFIACQVDSREPLTISGLDFGAPATITMLDTGDFLGVCADGSVILCERKEVGDLLNSIADGRLFDQCRRLREATSWAYLVVTGSLQPAMNGKTLANGRQFEWEWSSIQGSLLTVQELGVCIVYCAEHEYVATLTRLANRARGPVRIAPHRSAIPLTPGERILTSLPGIGDQLAQRILVYCPSPAWALAMLTDVTLPANVPGIGPGIRAGVRRALGLPEDMSMSVVVNESEQPAVFPVSEKAS